MTKPGESRASAKARALDAIEKLPDSADMEAIMYRLYVLDKIARGRRDGAEGRTLAASALKREIAEW